MSRWIQHQQSTDTVGNGALTEQVTASQKATYWLDAVLLNAEDSKRAHRREQKRTLNKISRTKRINKRKNNNLCVTCGSDLNDHKLYGHFEANNTHRCDSCRSYHNTASQRSYRRVQQQKNQRVASHTAPHTETRAEIDTQQGRFHIDIHYHWGGTSPSLIGRFRRKVRRWLRLEKESIYV